MTETQLKIIKQLFDRPNDQNATERELKRQLGILESDFRSAILSLLSDKVIEHITNENQLADNLKEKTTDYTAFALTLKGAVILNEYNKSSFSVFLHRYGKHGAFGLGILTLFAVLTQFYYSRERNYREESKVKTKEYLHIHLIQNFDHSLDSSCSCGFK